jgi:beta-glucosidase
MIYKKLSLSVLLFATGFLTASAQKSPQDMERFIDVLMNKMTLEEKIGQLNLPVTGEITTGQAKSSDIAAKIKKGEVGGLFNLKGVEKIREVQKQAVEDSPKAAMMISDRRATFNASSNNCWSVRLSRFRERPNIVARSS